MKAAVSLLVLTIWISSWIPTSAGRWAIYTVAGLILGLIAALFVQRALGDRRWPARAISALAYIALIGGALFAFFVRAVGTPADGAITIFFALGIVGYFFYDQGYFVAQANLTNPLWKRVSNPYSDRRLVLSVGLEHVFPHRGRKRHRHCMYPCPQIPSL